MATEKPNDPNTGGTGIDSRSQVFSPTFVGGQTDLSSGIIIPSNANNAATAPSPSSSVAPSSAPAPAPASPAAAPTSPTLGPVSKPDTPAPIAPQQLQQPTTQLGSLGNDTQPAATQKTPGFGDIARSFAPEAGTVLGAAVASPAVANTLGLGAINSFTQPALNSVSTALGGGAGDALGTATATGLGTIGDGSSAVAGFGGSAAGDAAASAVGGAAGGALSTILGAALPGVGAFAGGLIAGEKPLQAAEQGAGAAVGFAIGNFVLPGIGGLIGSVAGGALAGLFCHAAGTLLRMKDGSLKKVEDLAIGDDVFLGGKVLGRGEVLSGNLFEYRGTIVNGMHAVFECGQWIRVKDASGICAIEGPTVVYPIVTENHLLACEQYIAADFAETDDVDVSPSQRLALLNSMIDRNTRLLDAEHLLDAKRQFAA